MWPQTLILATLLLFLTGYMAASTSVLLTSGNTVNGNKTDLRQSTHGNVTDGKLYIQLEITPPAIFKDIVNQQRQLLSRVELVESKIQEQGVEIRGELETVERNLIEQVSEISASVKQEVELLKSNLTRDMQTSLLTTLKTILTRLEKKIDANAKPGYPSSCADAFEKDVNAESGIYTLHLPNSAYGNPFKVYCLDDPEGGAAWTVVQRRTDGSVDFYRGWDDYEAGFGDLKNEFFIGLKKLHALTNDQPYELWIQMEDFEGEKRFAKYSEFAIGDVSEKYSLNVLNGFTGNAGDSLAIQKGQQFSTKDRDNDNVSSNSCAITYTGAWWYNMCHLSNLNGRYLGGEHAVADYAEGINWFTWHGHQYSLKYVHMAVRPKAAIS